MSRAEIINADSALWAVGVSGLYLQYTLDASPLPAVAEFVRECSTEAAINGVLNKNKPGILLVGPPGVGKTGILVGAVRHYLFSVFDKLEPYERYLLCSSKSKAYFRPLDMLPYTHCLYREWFFLDSDIRRDNSIEHKKLDLLINARCIAIDTIDSRGMSYFRETIMLSLVERPYSGLFTIFACNTSLDSLSERLGPRIYDRLTDNRFYSIFTIKGKTLRNEV